MTKRKYIYCVADFETSFVDETKKAARVVLAGYSICYHKDKVIYFSNIKDFFDHLYERFHDSKYTVRMYYHNLDFDISFIEDYFLNANYEIVETRNFDTKVIYSAELKYKNFKIELYDSLKLYNSSLEKIGNLLGVHKLVGTYDYEKIRHGADDFTAKEIKYFKRDVIVLKNLIEYHYRNHKVLKLSRSSYAYADLKHSVMTDDKKRDGHYYSKIFKAPISKELYHFMHYAYYGGFSYLNDKYANQNLARGFVFDVNSLYPSQMVTNFPIYESIQTLLEKDYKKLNLMQKDLYCIIKIKLNYLRVKKDKFPSLPKKMNFRGNEVVKSIDDLQNPFITLTNIDLWWLFENYEVDYTYIQGYIFKGIMKAPFKSFILKNNKVKERARAKNDKLTANLAKNTNNSSYGKFGQRPDFTDSKPIIGKTGIVTFDPENNNDDTKNFNNIVLACFITAKARNVLYNAIKATNESKYFDFVYCDTDSIHVINHTKLETKDYLKVSKLLPIEIDPVKLGAWKLENDFKRARFLRSKAYFEDSTTDGVIIKLAGVTPEGKAFIADQIEKQGLSYFKLPLTVPSKRKHRIKGGFIIENYQKTIKPKSARFKVH